MITQKQIKELFTYKNDNLYWIKQPYKSHFDITTPAGTITSSGYRSIMINAKGIAAHRLVYIYHYGFFPETIDHINNNRLDNRIENLREATRAENNRNATISKANTSGFKGIVFCKQTQKWRGQVKVNNKLISAGRYLLIEEAVKAVRILRQKLHGDYTNHG